jgi:hypothetical protein
MAISTMTYAQVTCYLPLPIDHYVRSILHITTLTLNVGVRKSVHYTGKLEIRTSPPFPSPTLKCYKIENPSFSYRFPNVGDPQNILTPGAMHQLI